MQFDHLKRREFITLLGGAVAAWPLAARAQRPGRTIGYLGTTKGFFIVGRNDETQAFVVQSHRNLRLRSCKSDQLPTRRHSCEVTCARRWQGLRGSPGQCPALISPCPPVGERALATIASSFTPPCALGVSTARGGDDVQAAPSSVRPGKAPPSDTASRSSNADLTCGRKSRVHLRDATSLNS